VIWLRQVTNLIDSINLEHDGLPKTASHFSASCTGIAAGLMLSEAGVAELVDALDLGSSDESCGGSSPSARTIWDFRGARRLPREVEDMSGRSAPTKAEEDDAGYGNPQ
jgi:hypothetical protein